ncbi:hypothetical protein [Streptomyces tendae]|uniref:hypothetical protein n=1 Tax=Streptomyces tendae TaxID=1932 RepID=UPI00343BA1AC
MPDDYLELLGVVLPVVEAVPVWGPLLLAGMLAIPVWRWRAARRAVPGHVPCPVRTCADTDPDAHIGSTVTCADTSPEVFADPTQDVSGHEARGDQ